MATTRHRIPLSDREIAGKLLMRLARHPVDHVVRRHNRFCLDTRYDYDVEFLAVLSQDLGLPGGFPWKSLKRRLQKICRHLENWGVLYGRVMSCHAEYLGEPRTLKEYRFAKEEYAQRLAPDLYPHYKPIAGGPECELDFLLRRAYPED